MMTEQITKLLQEAENGDLEAKNLLFERVYSDLKLMAVQCLQREQPDNTLQPSALVNEVYLRLFPGRDSGDGSTTTPRQWKGRRQFFAVAANAMRQIMVDSARRKSRAKQGVDLQRVPFDPERIAIPEMAGQLLELDEALSALEVVEPLVAEVVHLRFFAGLTLREVAEELDIGRRTADGYWAYAKAWLMAEIKNSQTVEKRAS